MYIYIYIYIYSCTALEASEGAVREASTRALAQQQRPTIL